VVIKVKKALTILLSSTEALASKTLKTARVHNEIRVLETIETISLGLLILLEAIEIKIT
jgi:hypothetical protein